MRVWKGFVGLLAGTILTACGGGGGGSGSSGGGLGSFAGYDEYACRSDAAYLQAVYDLRIYQVMTEAFVDSDGAGYGVGYGTSHHNGDIRGIINALDYIESLNVNAIWLTPVFESVALNGQDLAADRLDATGYYATNYFRIDPNFGTLADARELVDEAHARGIYVFFDGVFGHFKRNASDVVSPEGRRLSTSGNTQATTGREAVYPGDRAYFKEVAAYWIETLKIDGYRLDQAYQVPIGAWGEIREVVDEASASVTYNLNGRTVNPLGYMVAEVWKGETDIADEAYGPVSGPGLCSAFDFPMRYRIVQTLAAEENASIFNRRASTLNDGFATRAAYPAHAIPNVFISNHDLLRFGDLLERANLTAAGQLRYQQRIMAAQAFLAANSGPITLYYGEEVGDQVDGFDDPVSNSTCANRGLCDDHVARTSGKVAGLATQPGDPVFSPNAQQTAILNRVRSLMDIRADNPALSRGSRQNYNAGDAIYVDYKVSGSNRVVFILNVTETAQTLFLPRTAVGSGSRLENLESGTDIINAVGASFSVSLDPLEAVFYEVF